MIDCNLGPDFKSCFLGHKQSEYGKTFTVRLAKHMCYEDARLVQHFVNQKAMRQWIDAVTDFCEGNNVLRDCLIGMTACYVDYFTKERGTTSAKAIMTMTSMTISISQKLEKKKRRRHKRGSRVDKYLT